VYGYCVACNAATLVRAAWEAWCTCFWTSDGWIVQVCIECESFLGLALGELEDGGWVSGCVGGKISEMGSLLGIGYPLIMAKWKRMECANSPHCNIACWPCAWEGRCANRWLSHTLTGQPQQALGLVAFPQPLLLWHTPRATRLARAPSSSTSRMQPLRSR
jgi:hypothetical protein